MPWRTSFRVKVSNHPELATPFHGSSEWSLWLGASCRNLHAGLGTSTGSSGDRLDPATGLGGVDLARWIFPALAPVLARTGAGILEGGGTSRPLPFSALEPAFAGDLG